MADPETKPNPVLFAAGIAGMIIVLMSAYMIFGRKKPPGNPICTLQTEPSGATIVSIRRDRMLEQMAEVGVAERDPNTKPPRLESTFGTTPISKRVDDWYTFGTTVFEARLDGYRPMTVRPLDGNGCSPTFTLEKQ